MNTSRFNVQSMVHRYGVIMEHHKQVMSKQVKNNGGKLLAKILRTHCHMSWDSIHSHKKCFWVFVCKWHGAQPEYTPILCNHVPTGKARCTSQHCICNIWCGCSLAHKIIQKFPMNSGVIPCWFQNWTAASNTSHVFESTSSQLYKIFEETNIVTRKRIFPPRINWVPI